MNKTIKRLEERLQRRAAKLADRAESKASLTDAKFMRVAVAEFLLACDRIENKLNLNKPKKCNVCGYTHNGDCATI